MGNDEGGRVTQTAQDAGDILDRSEPASRRPALGPKPPFVGGGADATATMAKDADELYSEATALEDLDKGPAKASPGLIRAYNHVVEALETPGVELHDDVAASLQMATSALARAAAGRRGREELRVLAAGLTQRLRRIGYSSQDATVGILADEDPSTRAAKAIQSAEARVDELNAALDHAPQIARVGLIAQYATIAATFMREGSTVRNAPKQLNNPANSLAESVQSLLEHCRTLGVELESSHLDLILRGADDVLEAAGKDRRNFLANYYGKRTIVGMTGSREPGSKKLGEKHVQDVVQWLRSPALAATVYADISSIVKEPPVTKEKSLFERLLTDAVVTALGQLPTVLFKALSGVAGKAGKAMMGTADEAAPTGDQPELWKVLDGLGDGRATPGKAPDEGLFNLASAIGPHLIEPLEQGAKSVISENIKTGLATNQALSSVFIDQVKAGAVADLAARFQATDELEGRLAMMPPAEVQSMFERLKERTLAESKAHLSNLVMLWADFVVKATSGLDAAGTVNQLGGTIETTGNLPGSVQIPLTVTVGATIANDTLGPTLQPATTPARRSLPTTFRVGTIHMNGMSPSGLANLRDANLPMATAKLHRVYQVTVIADGYVTEERIDVNPEGVVDASGADPRRLAKIGSVNPGVWSPAPNIIGVDEPNAQEGVRQILSMGNLTTAAVK